MEIPVSQRIKAAVEDAEMLFWAHIAAKFPEAKSGDFPVELTIRSQAHLIEWVRVWVRMNTNLMPYEPDSPQWFGQIALHLADLNAQVDDGGGGIIGISIPVGNYWTFWGTANDTWGADVYIKEFFGDLEGSLNSAHPSNDYDTLACANAIREAVYKFKRDGEMAK